MSASFEQYKLSFIIIGKNEGWKLSLCFDSVNRCIKNSGIVNYEIIYVDAKSSDNSIEIAKEHQVTKIFSISVMSNSAIARNIGGREAEGDILLFLDGDMELQSDFIPMLQKENKTLIHPFVSGMICHSYYDKDWTLIKTEVKNRIAKNTFEAKVGGFFVITKQLWDSVNGMDIKLVANEDADLALRLAKKGILLLCIAQVCVCHHTIAYTDNLRFWSTIKRYCYVALLARKYFYCKNYWSTTFRMNYSSWLLAISLVGLVIPNSFYLCYLFVLLCRSLNYGINTFLRMFVFFLLRDIVFVSSFLLFYPRKKKVVYHKI